MAENYPYTTVPQKLREFLKGVPTRAVPEKVTRTYLKGIGMKSSSDRSILPVLKAVKLLGPDGSPTENYRLFRDISKGPNILGAAIKQTYAPLYNVYEDAHTQPDINLRNHFRSVSDLSDAAVNYQIATFKALAEFADFKGSLGMAAEQRSSMTTAGGRMQLPAFHVDMHIHLPDSKDSSVYDSIFQAISKHIMKAVNQ